MKVRPIEMSEGDIGPARPPLSGSAAEIVPRLDQDVEKLAALATALERSPEFSTYPVRQQLLTSGASLMCALTQGGAKRPAMDREQY